MKSFIESQFSYCPLIWMFHSRKMEHRINNIHERALRVVYENSKSLTFSELLQKDNSVSIHQRNLQILATEIFKEKQGGSPKIISDLFCFVNKPYNLRNTCVLEKRKNRTVYFGDESVSSLAPKIWELIPGTLKNETSLSAFKQKIKTWRTEKCPCRLCKKYVGNVGFI